MVKLSGILGGAVALLVLTLVARAQGVGGAQRGLQCSLNAGSVIASRPERTWLARACTASSGARPVACPATLTRPL
jgi:hypothetical protein